MCRSARGFTIVELLIVIVVIAILAAITLVSYRGIQEKAHNAVTISAANAWVNLLSASYSMNGPIDITLNPAWAAGVCLGSVDDYNGSVGDLDPGECFENYFADDILYEKLSQVGNASMQPYGFNVGDGRYSRGIQYGFDRTGANKHALLYYDLVGVQKDCGISGSYILEDANNTTSTDCRVDMTEKLGGHPIYYD